MKRSVSMMVAIALCVHGVSILAGEAAVSKQSRDQLRKLLATLKVKAATTKPVEHRLSLPTATAGARGVQVRADKRFAVLWPAENIPP